MNTMRVITVVCWLVAALVLIGLAIWFLTGSVFGINSDRWNININIGDWEALTGPYEAVGVYTPGTEGINSLSVDWINGDVTVKPYDGDNFQITEFAQRELKENEKLKINTSAGTLTIKYKESGTVLRMPQKNLEVLVPRTLCETFNKLSAESVSGAVTVESINAETLSANSISGDIKISNSVSRMLDLDTTSGSITVEFVQTDNITINSISGEILVSDSMANTLSCDTTSGDVGVSGAFDSTRFNSISGEMSLDNSASGATANTDSTSGSLRLSGSFSKVDTNTMSGSISITSKTVPDELTVDTTSGSIKIALPNEGAVSVHYSSTSGGFTSDIPVIMQEQGAQIRISSLSGDARILALDSERE